ncbi:MAG: sensor histidine kinase [Dehalococcoidia bacterium]
MKQELALPVKSFDGLSRQQLLIYAKELGEHFVTEQSLQRVITDRERQVRDLIAATISAQEEERQWIALEVHDRIAQTLASVFQQLQSLESMVKKQPEVRQKAVRASKLVREAIRESRNIMNDLHPPGLDEFGVIPIIEEELHRFREETRCQTRFDSNCRTRPPREVEVALYRIFREALINVRKHATTATKVAVALEHKGPAVNLRVQDNGGGFDLDAASQRKGVGGLVSMQKRAEVIGGTLHITTNPGRGTTVTVRFPITDGSSEGGQKDDHRE